jgi:two-component system chemotaxis response regulator CheB
MIRGRRIRVLVVDDSAIVRKLISEAISTEPDLEVVGTAPDPFVARDQILRLQPDVLTLDIEMPRMDGLTFLKKLMKHYPLPVIVISSLGQASCQATLEAMQIGAVEVLAKPAGPYSVGELRASVAAQVRAAASARVRRNPETHGPEATEPSTAVRALRKDMVIAIGASTGGTEAIQQVLRQMPAESPAILVTQHIPPVFSTAFAARLNQLCSIEVNEACDGDQVMPGRALLAPGNFHLVLHRIGSGYRVEVKDGPLVHYQRPSVDVMFSSVAAEAGPNAIGALLTGMGSDGANGLLQLKRAGATTIAQDESTCVVFGMPREAIRLGAVDHVLPISRVAGALLDHVAIRT